MSDTLKTIVTGAANGIGAAIVERLRARGDEVVGIDRERVDGVIQADLAVADDREGALDEAISRLRGVSVLINAAGIFRAGSILDSTLDDWNRVWAVDLHAPIDLMRGVAEQMAAQGFGRIVNITSVHAASAQPGCLAYDVAKAGLEAATRSAALDLARAGVLVNAVAPGFVRTRMSLLPDGTDETDSPAFATTYVEGGKLPLGRAAQPAEVASIVAYLASRDNTYVTGQVITVDGGLTMTF